MRRNRSDPLLFDPEPELLIRRRRAHLRLTQATMDGGGAGGGADRDMEARIEAQVQERLAQRLQEQERQNALRTLREHAAASMTYDYQGSIVYPNPEGVHFELRPAFISLVGQHQFGGSSLEDPPLTWRGSLETVILIGLKFTTKYVPRAVLRKKLNEITAFAQTEAENLHEAWERFKRLLRKCPQHGLSAAEQINKFYDGLLYSVKSTLDAAANGEFDALHQIGRAHV